MQRRASRIIPTALFFTVTAAIATNPAPAQPVAAPPKPVLPVPTHEQLAWQQLEFIVFVHFGMNTFTNREWGDGSENPEWFQPSDFDARQWVEVFKDAGARLVILTAKHHDGFCLWPSAYTEHSVKNSPWRDGRGDVVREVSDACREAGLLFGVYLSPWDRHEASYGDSPRYNEYFKNQLRELLTNYGDIGEVWFDGANGEGPNGKRQVYDWAGYYATVRECQPGAAIAIVGPDVRWVGNESGVARETEWSVQVVPGGETIPPMHWMNRTLTRGPVTYLTEDRYTSRAGELLAWHPAECDVSIRPGWFYHPEEDGKVKSLDHLLDIYDKSIGRNSVLLLNVPPDRRGRIHENDAVRLREFRAAVDAQFAENLAKDATAKASNVRGGDDRFSAARALDGLEYTYWAADGGVREAWIEIELPGARTLDAAVIQEPIALGQRVARFALEAWADGEWREIASGTTIGYKRLARFEDITTNRIRLVIQQSRGCPLIESIQLYNTRP